MKWTLGLVGAGVLMHLGFADVLDLGDLDQFNPQITALPTGIGSNSVWLSRGNDGYDLVMSDDVRSKVQGVLQGCGQMDNKCYQDIDTILTAADLEIDQALERRGFAQLLSKTFKKYAAVFEAIKVFLLANWKTRQQEVQELGIWAPDVMATSFGAVATATAITISAGGTEVATVTPTQAPTTLIGSVTPAVTVVATPSSGFDKGDLVALLDEDLASRVHEYMARVGTLCEDGTAFDKAHPTKKRAGGTLGQAICGAEAVAAAAVPGGLFNDLLLLNPTQLPFGFADVQDATAQAADVVLAFVHDYGPLLAVTDELADQLAVYLFALAIDALVDNIPLSNQNRIASSLVTTRTTSAKASSTSSCPDPTKTPLACGATGQDCDIQMPQAPQTEAVCASGQYKGCECSLPPVVSFDNANSALQQTLRNIGSLLTKPKLPTCSIKVTDIPAALFSSDQYKVYTDFCKAWKPGTAANTTYDANGNARDPQPKIKGRTPPPNPASYLNWNFDLYFTPSSGGGSCKYDCNTAFDTFAGACSSNAGGVYMYPTGSLDADCGTYGYNLYEVMPPVPPTTSNTEKPQFCYQLTNFAPTVGDINSWWVSQYSDWACAGTSLKTIRKGDSSTFIQLYTETNGAPYQYNIWWDDGCTLENNGPMEVYPSNPLGISNPGHTICQNYLINNWSNCKNNKGVGGNIQVGCLIYEFKADRSKRTW